MACLIFSTCRLTFIPGDTAETRRDYSPRTLIELRQHDIYDFFLRALDIDDNRKEIFNTPLEHRRDYRISESNDGPDEITAPAGVYQVWILEENRSGFHSTVKTCLELIESQDGDEPDEPKPQVQSNSNASSERSREDPRPVTTSLPVNSPKSQDILLDLNRFNRDLEQGNGRDAVQMVNKLIAQRCHVQQKTSPSNFHEEPFTIDVQIDGNEYGVDQSGANISLQVFPSTTIRELRAIFENVHQFPSWNQYFFVNGLLAHDQMDMRQLRVGPNSLFILYLIKHLT